MSRPSTKGQTGKSSSAASRTPGSGSDAAHKDAKASAALSVKLRQACEPLAAAHSCDLEEVEIKQAGARSRVAVSVDRDGGVDLDTLTAFSRDVSELLDSPRWVALMAGAYTLDIGSRGVDRPLEAPRHWRRAEGRLVKVDLANKTTLKGRITELHEDHVVLTVERDPRYHSTKPPKQVEVAFADVRRAVVEVDFRNVPPDDAPEDPEIDGESTDGEVGELDGVSAEDFIGIEDDADNDDADNEHAGTTEGGE